MVRLLLEILGWVTALGYVVFCILYVWLAAPWRDKIGRGILAFMLSLTIAFLYSLTSKWLAESVRHTTWLFIIPFLTITIWSAVVVLIKYQLAARGKAKEDEFEAEYDKEEGL